MLLGDIAKLSAGYPFRGKIPELKDSGVFCIQMKDIPSYGELNWTNLTEVRLTGKRPPNLLTKGDIIFNARGNINKAYHLDNKPMNDTVCAPYFFILRIKPAYIGVVFSGFIAWQINQQPAQNYFSREAEGSVTKSIRRTVLEKMPIVIPDIQQQKTIIALEQSLTKEKLTYQKLLDNSQKIMNKLTAEIYLSHGVKIK